MTTIKPPHKTSARKRKPSLDANAMAKAAEELQFATAKLHELSEDEHPMISVRAAEALAKLAVRAGGAEPVSPQSEQLTVEELLNVFEFAAEDLLKRGSTIEALKGLLQRIGH